MNTEELLEGNKLIAEYMGWNYGSMKYNLPDIIALTMVVEKISDYVEHVSLKVKSPAEGVIQWTASIKTIPYRNLGHSKGATSSEALYKAIVNYLKKK